MLAKTTTVALPEHNTNHPTTNVKKICRSSLNPLCKNFQEYLRHIHDNTQTSPPPVVFLLLRHPIRVCTDFQLQAGRSCQGYDTTSSRASLKMFATETTSSSRMLYLMMRVLSLMMPSPLRGCTRACDPSKSDTSRHLESKDDALWVTNRGTGIYSNECRSRRKQGKHWAQR